VQLVKIYDKEAQALFDNNFNFKWSRCPRPWN
jgi:hypothetical protein